MLETVQVLRTLPDDRIARLEAAGSLVEPHDGTTIFLQGDPATAVYAIVLGDGRVRIGAASDNSKALMVEVFHAGDLFGEIGVIDGQARTAEARVEGRLRLVRIPAAAFLSVLGDTPELGNALCRLLAHRLRRTFALLQDATFERLEVRLARQLLYLGDRHGRRTPLGLRLAGRFRHADLADLLGATPRSIITILNGWRVNGLLAFDPARGLLTLQDEEALRAMVR